MNVLVVGAGKVGRALSRALRASGARVSLTRARSAATRRSFACELLVIAASDPWIADVATAVADRLHAAARAERPRAVVHVAGALGVEPLAPFRSVNVPVGRMHPLLSFSGRSPAFAGATLRLGGDAAAVRAGRRVAGLLGMVPRVLPSLPDDAYHAAAALLANGAVALASEAAVLLGRYGVSRPVAAEMLAPLLASVAANLAALGLPTALSGPVRRGDARTVGRHLAAFGPPADLYRAVVAAQIGLAREIREADPGALAAVAELVREDPQKRSKPGRSGRKRR